MLIKLIKKKNWMKHIKSTHLPNILIFFLPHLVFFFYDLFGLTWKYVPYMYTYLIHPEPDCVIDVADLFQTMNHLIAEQNSQSLVSPTCINDKKYPECS